MSLFYPTHIYVETAVKSLPLTCRIIANANHVPVTIVESKERLPEIESQKAILLARQRGPFIRYCPGTPKHICCMYHNLDLVEGCDLGCTYCILQAYLTTPITTFFCNHEDMYRELDHTLSYNKNRFYRIGTGELTDSLTFDHLTETSAELVDYFSTSSNAILELKTKSINIEKLLGLHHQHRTIISWSVNAPSVIAKEESQTPTLAERLYAAQEVQRAGYWLGFHFDPMIYFAGWEEEYHQVIEKIFATVNAEKIMWISLGALRYPPSLDEIIRKNHPQSDIVLGELLPGIDHKLRYLRSIRIQFFSKMYQWIRKYSEQVFVYLCMESDEIWTKAFGWSPKSSAGLKKLLDERVINMLKSYL